MKGKLLNAVYAINGTENPFDLPTQVTLKGYKYIYNLVLNQYIKLHTIMCITDRSTE